MSSKTGKPRDAEQEEAVVRPAAGGGEPATLDHDHPKVRQILEAAGRLFMDLPYDAVSTDAIAREAKVSKATLYVYFSSKENLFATLVGARCDRIARQALGTSAAVEDVEGNLYRFAHGFIDMLESADTLPLYRSIVSQAVRFPELGRLFYESAPEAFEQRLAQFLADATRRGLLDVPDPALAALQFIQLMIGDLLAKGLLGLDPPLASASKARIASGIALFMAGYGPKSRRAGRTLESA